MSIVLILLFLIAVIVGAVRHEYQTSQYWFLTLIGVFLLHSAGALGVLGV